MSDDLARYTLAAIGWLCITLSWAMGWREDGVVLRIFSIGGGLYAVGYFVAAFVAAAWPRP